jgi:phospholipase C
MAGRGGARRTGLRRLTGPQDQLIEQAATSPAAARPGLTDIEHVVILMQENRSFDHFFGTMSAVRGFSDPAALRQPGRPGRPPVFDQFGWKPGTGPDPDGYLQPFRLVSDPPLRDGQTTNDISHTWETQHRSWNGGAMDSFLSAHLAADRTENAPLTVGYYTREDLPLRYALADAFTVCDHYFSSVIGPTDPNRLMAMSATIDPEGRAGGPVVQTYGDRLAEFGRLRWETMPERLLDAGVTWRIYNDPLATLALSPLPYFHAYADPFSVRGIELIGRAFTPSYPHHFREDVAAGTLPSVCWIMPPLAQSDHPAAPPDYGECLVESVLRTLVGNPEVWAATALFVVYDENGGFFDHVPPPAAPEGTEGEWLSGPLPSAAAGIRGPVGLGFRVPCLVISPFSRGGYLCSDVLDHTSLLRFIETRFGVAVPNLSAWRRGVTGDMTGALALSRKPEPGIPPLPGTSLGQDVSVAEQAVLDALAGTLDVGIPYPPPAANAMPVQEEHPPRPLV